MQLSLSITTCINFVTARWNFHFHSPPGFVLLRAMSNFHFHSLPGFVQIFASVLPVFKQCFTMFTRFSPVFNKCLTIVSKVFQKCIKNVTKMFPKWFQSVSKVFQSCLLALKSSQLPEHKEGSFYSRIVPATKMWMLAKNYSLIFLILGVLYHF